jgi:hypothetical protein
MVRPPLRWLPTPTYSITGPQRGYTAQLPARVLSPEDPGGPIAARVICYCENDANVLADAFAAQNIGGSGDYYLSLPAITNTDSSRPPRKTWPRPASALLAGEFGSNPTPNIHPLAEFNWPAWANSTDPSVPSDWYSKGVVFRQRMVEQGYAGTEASWFVNEFPSSVRSTNATDRANAVKLLRGLYDSDGRHGDMPGLVAMIGVGSRMVNMGTYKANLKSWFEDSTFWSRVRAHVRWWLQEAFTRPHEIAVPQSTYPNRRRNANYFLMHPARLVFHGHDAGAPVTDAYLAHSSKYTPLFNGAWSTSAARTGPPWWTNRLDLTGMSKFFSLQLSATRAWSASNRYPEQRAAFGWHVYPGRSAPDLAASFAEAIAATLGPDGADDGACSVHGCDPEHSGAAFNSCFRDVFETWEASGVCGDT